MARVAIVFTDTDLEREEFSLELEGVDTELEINDDTELTVAEWVGRICFNKVEEFVAALSAMGGLVPIEEDDE